MLPVRAWKLVYSDGSTWSSADGSWADAPIEDVQVLVLYHDPPYRDLVSGEDEYRLDGEAGVKHGRWMDADDFYTLVRRVVEEDTWPPRTT